MISNISKSGGNFYGAALYNQKKVDKGEGEIIGKRLIANTSPKQVDKNLKVLSNNSRVTKPVFHVSLSFAAEEKSKLNNEKLVEISKEYMERMGYGKQPYIIYRHDDTAHPHVHILSTRVDIQSKAKINDSHERYRSRDIVYELELKHGLEVSYHRNKNHTAIKEDLKGAMRRGPVDNKSLNKAMGKVGSDYRVKQSGRGVVYYKVGEDEKRKSKSWKSSDFKDVGFDKKGLASNFKLHREYREEIRAAVVSSLKEVPTNKQQKIPLLSLERALSKHGIQPKYAINEKGIYGLSFKYKDKLFKASDVHRNLSWNKLKGYLDVPDHMELRQALKNSLGSGAKVEMKYNGKRVEYSSSNNDLAKRLSELGGKEAIDLARMYNGHSEKMEKIELPDEKQLFKAMAGHNIDDYLQKQYEVKQAINQRQHRISR